MPSITTDKTELSECIYDLTLLLAARRHIQRQIEDLGVRDELLCRQIESLNADVAVYETMTLSQVTAEVKAFTDAALVAVKDLTYTEVEAEIESRTQLKARGGAGDVQT